MNIFVQYIFYTMYIVQLGYSPFRGISGPHVDVFSIRGAKLLIKMLVTRKKPMGLHVT